MQPYSLTRLRETLVDNAKNDAGLVVAAAHEEAGAILQKARDAASTIIADARARALDVARGRAEASIRKMQRSCRTQVLSAQSAACDRLRQQARQAAEAAASGDGYKAVLGRLEATAKRQLGAAAAVTVEAGAAGITAQANSMRVDYTLSAIADRIVDELLPQFLEELSAGSRWEATWVA
jgi:vacuolar-type H+-ATPase subunit E/Vma4